MSILQKWTQEQNRMHVNLAKLSQRQEKMYDHFALL